jgi:hypothetical protein
MRTQLVPSLQVIFPILRIGSRGCARAVDSSWIDGENVRFAGTILDEEIGDKIVKGLISKVSLGLHARACHPANARSCNDDMLDIFWELR